MRTLLRIIKNETFSAYILIPIGVLAIALGSHFNSNFLEQSRHIFGWHFNLREATLDYLLGFFFYAIGLELRFEFLEGTLKNRRILTVSALAATLGMAVPAIIFVLYSHANGTPSTGWGITMATDLPFVLAMLGVLKRNNLRGFVLALATLDDIGSVIVLSVIYKVHLHIFYLLTLAVVLVLYVLVSYYLNSRTALIVIFTVGLAVGHLSGIQTSLVAVLFGILTINNRKQEIAIPSKVLNLASPFSAFVVIPLFVFISLFRRFDFSAHALGSTLVLSLIIVRLIGKPLGIFLGIVLGRLLVKIPLPFLLGDAILIGALGTLGLDVSLIFAQRDFTGLSQNLAITGILLTIPAGIILSLLVHFLNRGLRTKGENIL